jgi:cytochrome P450
VQEIPLIDVDLFSWSALKDPFPVYRRIRDLGPVVRIRDPACYALARFDDVRDALKSPDVLISGRGIVFNDTLNNAQAGASVIASDGDRHRHLRRHVMRPLVPKDVQLQRSDLHEIIASHVATLIGRGWFDAVEELAQHLPVAVVSHLVGLPDEGRRKCSSGVRRRSTSSGRGSNTSSTTSPRAPKCFAT